ncbi:PolC-type DNA polymerase III [Hahella sp. CCB-MM4]|uniref:3'-5' exonuclease n=1 Tax=Hahella sp. (strain CCB-MM4) TaxID=1926491 RepID=UPI000B9BB403|nr:3'-5' exonuclease [Hahella sp. CCB-MM4]
MQNITSKWPPPEASTILNQIRWVVVDVETTGLNIRKDRVIAIGAVEIDQMKINLKQSFERVFDPGVDLEHENVLIHGLSPQELQQGTTPEQGLKDFLDFAAGSPLLAFHAPFDKHMLEKESKQWLGVSARLPCYDVADFCLALFPDLSKQLRGLDAWLEHFGLEASERHHATCDAMATAELALICLQKAYSEGIDTWGQLIDRISTATKLHRSRHTF